MSGPGRPPHRPPIKSGWQLFLQNNLRDLLVPLTLVAAGVVLLALYWLGVLPERWAGACLATAVVVGACALTMAGLIPSAQGSFSVIVTIAVTLAVAFTAAAPLLGDLFPGIPVAHATLKNSGDAVPIPSDVKGPVRVLAEVHPSGTGAFSCRAELAIGPASVPLDLSREPQTVRVGKRGRGMVMQEHSSVYAHGSLAPGDDKITLATGAGASACAIDLSVFPERIPFNTEMGIAGLLVIAISVLGAILGTGITPGAAAGAALGFGLIVVGGATPAGAVRPAIGAILGGIPAGGAVGGVVSWLCAKLFGKRKPQTARFRR